MLEKQFKQRLYVSIWKSEMTTQDRRGMGLFIEKIPALSVLSPLSEDGFLRWKSSELVGDPGAVYQSFLYRFSVPCP